MRQWRLLFVDLGFAAIQGEEQPFSSDMPFSSQHLLSADAKWGNHRLIRPHKASSHTGCRASWIYDNLNKKKHTVSSKHKSSIPVISTIKRTSNRIWKSLSPTSLSGKLSSSVLFYRDRWIPLKKIQEHCQLHEQSWAPCHKSHGEEESPDTWALPLGSHDCVLTAPAEQVYRTPLTMPIARPEDRQGTAGETQSST